jgi:hypothetical protein
MQLVLIQGNAEKNILIAHFFARPKKWAKEKASKSQRTHLSIASRVYVQFRRQRSITTKTPKLQSSN